jgi:2-isopropylmalate synthase
MLKGERVYLYDTTLRDGAQTRGIDFSARDKLVITNHLDDLGIDYIEGGWPGANPTDDYYFEHFPKVKNAKIVAFGMTRKPGHSTQNDPILAAVLNSGAQYVQLFGKAWDFQVDLVLNTTLEENLAMVYESIMYARTKVSEVHFIGEHFFDGYKHNPDYAKKVIQAAHEAGAEWLSLADTNGGTLPDEIYRIVCDLKEFLPDAKFGIHCHNDTENAIANSLAALRAGARLVQGCLNGYGERCGNTNLISLIATLALKTDYTIGVTSENLKKLTYISREVDERVNQAPNAQAAYVGKSAFSHKGGVHGSAVKRNAKLYEHVEPNLVGNERFLVISQQAGKATIKSYLSDLGVEGDISDEQIVDLIEEVKDREFSGYFYDGAEASFKLLVLYKLGQVPNYFNLISYTVVEEKRTELSGDPFQTSKVMVRLQVGDDEFSAEAEGYGPIHAMDLALREALSPVYSSLGHIKLVDYKVRVLTPREGASAVARVVIDSMDEQGHQWSTVGVSKDILDASFEALFDSMVYKLLRTGICA